MSAKRERKKSKDHKTKHVERSEGATLEMKTEGAFKRQQRHPEAEVRIRYDTRHGSLPLACSPSLLNQGEQCSEQKEIYAEDMDMQRQNQQCVLCDGMTQG